MAVLLVGMSVAAVLVTAAMPVWKQLTRREREAELVFRGQQYVRAIGLFQKRAGPGVLPPNVDVLVSGRFLRKKYKDPITNGDFDLLSPVQAAGPGGPGGGRGVSSQQPPASASQGTVVGAQPATAGAAPGAAAGGIIGVASKSKEPSLRIYNGRTHYNEWQFVFVAQTQAPAPGGAGGRGTPADGQGQRGTPPFGGFQGGQGSGPGRQGQPGPTGRGAPGGGRGQSTPQPQPGSPFPSPQGSPFQPRGAR